MGTEAERQDTRKAMLYDLQKIIKSTPNLDPKTVDEIFNIMDNYINIASEK